MEQIVILTDRDSEKLFYELLATNRNIAVKKLCRKIPRKMLYKYLKQLDQIQQATGTTIFERKASLCPVTRLPNIIIEVKCIIDSRESLVILSPHTPSGLCSAYR